jgi:hypothetical protein
MARSLRTSFFGLVMIAALLIGISAVCASTATATLGAGSLTITAAPANFSYSGTLTGDLLNLSSSFAVGVNDATGSKAGWNLQATVGVLTTAGSDTIPASAHTIQSVAVSGTTGIAPVNSISYPMAIPTSAGKIFNSAATKGMGKSTETFTTQLAVPADAAAGTYSATLTVTIVAGP